MVKIYTAKNIQHARLLSDLLHANAINHIVKNLDLQMALGELPLGDSLPSIWTPEEEAKKAILLIEKLEEKKVEGLVWQCRCGEVLEPQFGACWKCGMERK